MSKEAIMVLPDEAILSRIYIIRGMKVMIDRDLAEMYDVETKRLKEAVKRSIENLYKNDVKSKNNIPPSESDEGAEGHGTVVFAFVTTVPCSGLLKKISKNAEFFEG